MNILCFLFGTLANTKYQLCITTENTVGTPRRPQLRVHCDGSTQGWRQGQKTGNRTGGTGKTGGATKAHQVIVPAECTPGYKPS